MMLTREQIVGAVEQAAKEYPIRCVYLYGSYADGTATEQSDVDFYVLFDRKPVSFFKVVGLRGRLETLLGKEVDIVKHRPPDEDAAGMVCVYEA